MPRYKLVVMTKPAKGRESEYNDWYQNLHLHQFVKLDAIRSAQRFRLTHTFTASEPFPYLAIYDVETGDPQGLVEEIRIKAANGTLMISDALDPEVRATLYEEFGEAVKS